MRRFWATTAMLGGTLGISSGCPDDGGQRDAAGTSGVTITAGSTGGSNATDGGSQTTSAQTSAATSGTSTASESADDAADTSQVIWDVNTVPDAPAFDDGCQKVDFLFVIDNSGSMSTSQANVVANFDAFITGIQSTLTEVDDYQVGIVTTDKYQYNDPNCRDLGSLVVSTGGSNSSDTVCGPYAEGYNFMTQQDDLAQTFSCAAQLGTSGGGFELTFAALEEAVSGDLADPGECNEGFLRPDSLLVIVIITDEADGPGDPEGTGYTNPQGGPTTSPGDPASWFDNVVASKAGIEQNIVVLSLFNWYGGPCEPSSTFFDGQNIHDFTTMFTNGFVGGICEPDYGPYFTEAVSVIEDACENYIPPG